jgi:hypothetical protein
MEQEKVKQFVRQIQEEGKSIIAEWDAGGDQTMIWCNVLDEEGNEIEVEEAWKTYLDTIDNYIVFELNLPNAGETYHRGKGKIVYKDDEVSIIYDAKEFTSEYEDETIEFSLNDHFGLLDYQYRANISFSLRLGQMDNGIYDKILEEEQEEDERFNIRIRVLEGDTIPISDEMKRYYQVQFEQEAKRFEAELGKMLDGKMLCEITLTYDERDLLGKGMMKVDKYYELSNIYQGEEVILTD